MQQQTLQVTNITLEIHKPVPTNKSEHLNITKLWQLASRSRDKSRPAAELARFKLAFN